MQINNVISLIFLCTSISCTSMEQELGKKLLGASYAGDLEEIKECLARGAPINYANEDGETALWIAVNRFDFEAAQLLLQQPNIDVNTRARNVTFPTREYPIHSAVHPRYFSSLTQRSENLTRQFKLLKLLIEKGANINATEQNEKKETPLHVIVYFSNDNALALGHYLISRGAQMKEATEDQLTPLQQAVHSSNIKPALMAMLLKSPHITLADLSRAQLMCKAQFHELKKEEKKLRDEKQQLELVSPGPSFIIYPEFHLNNCKTSLKVNQTSMHTLSLKARILQSYYLMVRSLGFKPGKEGWEPTTQQRFPLEVAKLIAHHAAWNTEHSILHKHLNFKRVWLAYELFNFHELLIRCAEHTYRYYGIDFWYPTPLTFEELHERYPSEPIYMVYENERPVGTFMLARNSYYPFTQKIAWHNPDAQSVYIDFFAIDPHFQRQKIGTHCIKEMEHIAKQNNYSALRLFCREHPWLYKFYKKNKFKHRGIISMPHSTGNLTCFEKILRK